MRDMKSTAALEKCLDQLGLHSMLRHYANLAVTCNLERAPYEVFLLLLCERELRDRCTVGASIAQHDVIIALAFEADVNGGPRRRQAFQ